MATLTCFLTGAKPRLSGKAGLLPAVQCLRHRLHASRSAQPAQAHADKPHYLHECTYGALCCVNSEVVQKLTLPSLNCQVEGLFYNYFSVGLDATAAYGFHHLRETRPWAAPSRLINQAWYAYFSCASGWFCCAPPLNITATLKVWLSVAVSVIGAQIFDACLRPVLA